MINTVNIPKAYTEVYEFINALGEEYINKLPQNIYDTIKNNRDMTYKIAFKSNQKIQEGMLSKEALALISALNLQYWCKDEVTKKELKQVYINNAKIEEEKYSYENLFKNNTILKEETEEQENVNMQMIEYREENIIQKIINSIKNLFNKFRK